MQWHKMMLGPIFGVALAGVAAHGTHSPDSDHRSQLVRDLRATRNGNQVTLNWSQPRQVTDQQSLVGRPLVARVCRDISLAAPQPLSASTSSTMTRCVHLLQEVDPRKSPASRVRLQDKNATEVTVRFIDRLPEDLAGSGPSQFARYAVELRDDRGRSAGFSNPAAVSLAPLRPAEGLHSELDVRGVYLIWDSEIETQNSALQFDYRIYRREKNHPKRVAVQYLRAVVHTRDGDRWSGVDTSVEWGKTYVYWVTPVTRVYSEKGRLVTEVEGDDSAPLQVITHDVFPPAVPERLLVLPSQIRGKKFIDIVWGPNIEKDLAGYNIYRREEGGKPSRINSTPITMLSFQDTDVAAGHNYFYSLSAVDTHGNESAKSSEIAGTLP
ncbi:MAG TPA: hypothetical protein VI488_15525 [Candidatus Angelobacter sp.]